MPKASLSLTQDAGPASLGPQQGEAGDARDLGLDREDPVGALAAFVGEAFEAIGHDIGARRGKRIERAPESAVDEVLAALQDLLGGHIPVVFGEMGSSKALVTSGQLRALAVTGQGAMALPVTDIAAAGSCAAGTTSSSSPADS